jgi:Protein of unknown function (DUF3997)
LPQVWLDGSKIGGFAKPDFSPGWTSNYDHQFLTSTKQLNQQQLSADGILIPHLTASPDRCTPPMPKNSKIILLLILFFLLCGVGIKYFLSKASLGPGGQDFTKNLTGKYQLYRMSSHNIFIAPNGGWRGDDAIIPEKVLRLNEVDDFIIAERQGLKRRSPKDSLDTYMIPDSTVLDYWILNTRNNTVFKSLTKQRLITILDSLKLPKDLKLVDVYEY